MVLLLLLVFVTPFINCIDIDTACKDKYVVVGGSDSCITVLDIDRQDQPGAVHKSSQVARFEVKNSPI